MPGTDGYASVTMIESPVLGSLKAHKVLPRKEKATSMMETGTRQKKTSKDVKKRHRETFVTSEGIRSWIPDPSQNGSLPVVVQPLTPPINIRDTFKSWMDDEALSRLDFSRSESSGTTPLVHQSPPTPETTPPHKAHRKPIRHDQPTPQISVDRMTQSSRLDGESRTDSFKTAAENLSSDDEFFSQASPSLKPSRQKWLDDTGLSKHQGIGLGLGLDSEDEEEEPPTPKENGRSKQPGKTGEFSAFDGVWGSDARSTDDDTESQTTAVRDSSEKDHHRSVVNANQVSHQDSPTLGVTTPRPRSYAEKASVEATRKPDRSSSQQHGTPAQKTSDIDSIFEDANLKRLSQASSASTVVEAIVIDSTPQRRRTLRHTGKIVGVDSASSKRSSSRSVESSIHHRLRNVRSPTEGLRKSFEDNRREPPKPAMMVVPDRRASLQSTVASSKRASKTFSTSSQQQSSRPTTAPEDSVGYFDIPRRERKTFSVVIQQATPVREEIRVEKTLSSPIASDTSPPAATAASRELSRSASGTSGGMRTHYIPQTPPSQDSATPQPQEAQPDQVVDVRRSHSGDWTRPRSSLVTPFSLRSAHSSTPGTLEVNEATAVSIYPHTNESILVIQEMGGRDDASTQGQSTIIAGNASIALHGPAGDLPAPNPALLGPAYRTSTGSPLQNPRDAPQPPDVKLIPPTPANAASSSDETDLHARYHQRVGRFRAPLTSLRRAVSARRHSETVARPFMRSLSLRNQDHARRPRTAGDGDNRLHPTWRPRSFWETRCEDDSDSEFGNDGVLSPQRTMSYRDAPRRTTSLTQRVTNSFRGTSQPPQRRASIAAASPSRVPHYRAHAYTDAEPPPKRSQSLTRRIGGSLRLPYFRRPRLSSTADWSHQPHYEFVRSEDRNTKDVPRQGYQVQFVGFRGLAERFERRRESREEGKREERRNWLRGRIGPHEVTGFDMIHPPRVRPVADD